MSTNEDRRWLAVEALTEQDLERLPADLRELFRDLKVIAARRQLRQGGAVK